MNKAARFGVRQALAIGLAAFAAASLHLPNAFLAVLATQLLNGLGNRSAGELFRRLVLAWIGVTGGSVLLIAFPDQPWLSFPLFAVIAGIGTLTVLNRLGCACAIAFGMGIAATFPPGAVFAPAGLAIGFMHGIALSIAIISVWAAHTLLPFPKIPPAPPPHLEFSGAWTVGVTVVGAVICALLTFSSGLVVMTVAAFTTILALELAGFQPLIGQRLAGALAGAGLALLFIVAVSGNVANLPLYLILLCLVSGGLEWLANKRTGWATGCRQGAAVFAVGATMAPAPDMAAVFALTRVADILLGFSVAVLVWFAGARLNPAPAPAPKATG